MCWFYWHHSDWMLGSRSLHFGNFYFSMTIDQHQLLREVRWSADERWTFGWRGCHHLPTKILCIKTGDRFSSPSILPEHFYLCGKQSNWLLFSILVQMTNNKRFNNRNLNFTNMTIYCKCIFDCNSLRGDWLWPGSIWSTGSYSLKRSWKFQPSGKLILPTCMPSFAAQLFSNLIISGHICLAADETIIKFLGWALKPGFPYPFSALTHTLCHYTLKIYWKFNFKTPGSVQSSATFFCIFISLVSLTSLRCFPLPWLAGSPYLYTSPLILIICPVHRDPRTLFPPGCFWEW